MWFQGAYLGESGKTMNIGDPKAFLARLEKSGVRWDWKSVFMAMTSYEMYTNSVTDLQFNKPLRLPSVFLMKF